MLFFLHVAARCNAQAVRVAFEATTACTTGTMPVATASWISPPPDIVPVV
jgi:hypothetical protein